MRQRLHTLIGCRLNQIKSLYDMYSTDVSDGDGDGDGDGGGCDGVGDGDDGDDGV